MPHLGDTIFWLSTSKPEDAIEIPIGNTRAVIAVHLYGQLAPMAALRERFKKAGMHPYSLPLGVDIKTWLSHGQTGWDGYPDARTGKMDGETCALMPALAHSNIKIEDNAQVLRLVPSAGRNRIHSVVYRRNGEFHEVTAGLVLLACGTVKSAAFLLASEDGRLANSSGMVGRHLMGHNQTAVIGFDHRFLNDSVYQKTFGLNDFYLPGGAGGEAMGNVQLLGRVNGEIMKGNVPNVPGFILDVLCRRTVDFFLLGEDLPDPASRVLVRDGRIVLDRKRTNMEVHRKFIARFKDLLRDIGFKRSVHRTFGQFSIGHQCGTLRMGHSSKDSVVDPTGRASGPISPMIGRHDLCLMFTRDQLDPWWALGTLELRR